MGCKVVCLWGPLRLLSAGLCGSFEYKLRWPRRRLKAELLRSGEVELFHDGLELANDVVVRGIVRRLVLDAFEHTDGAAEGKNVKGRRAQVSGRGKKV